MTLARRLAAECLGTALLLAMVAGAGMTAGRLAADSAALALLANGVAGATGLLALILAFGAISGAHFNPLITLSEAWRGGREWPEALAYVAAQLAGACAGVAALHAVSGEPVFATALQARPGAGLWWSELVASFGLIGVIIGCNHSRPSVTPFAVAAYVMAATWCSASGGVANPAATLARAATVTAGGIRLDHVGGLAAAQLLGAFAATAVFGWLHGHPSLRYTASTSRMALNEGRKK